MVAGQLHQLERVLTSDGVKRWFGIRDERGTLVSLGALAQLEAVGHVDNVATFPRSRGRGLASAVTARIVTQARAAGAEHVCLFADPNDASVIGMYERLGFREVGRLPATRGPIPDQI
jgi:ribosomal protein S18 acetylase RimI-like enzyme